MDDQEESLEPGRVQLRGAQVIVAARVSPSGPNDVLRLMRMVKTFLTGWAIYSRASVSSFRP